jgi:hypothetical protein
LYITRTRSDLPPVSRRLFVQPLTFLSSPRLFLSHKYLSEMAHPYAEPLPSAGPSTPRQRRRSSSQVLGQFIRSPSLSVTEFSALVANAFDLSSDSSLEQQQQDSQSQSTDAPASSSALQMGSSRDSPAEESHHRKKQHPSDMQRSLSATPSASLSAPHLTSATVYPPTTFSSGAGGCIDSSRTYTL